MHEHANWTEIPYIAVPLEHVISGAAGGLSHSAVTNKLAFKEVARAVVIGALVSGYSTQSATSILCKWLSSAGYSASGLDDIVGFTMGLCGITVTETALIMAQRLKDRYGG